MMVKTINVEPVFHWDENVFPPRRTWKAFVVGAVGYWTAEAEDRLDAVGLLVERLVGLGVPLANSVGIATQG